MKALCDECSKKLPKRTYTVAWEHGYSNNYEGDWLTVYPRMVFEKGNSYACSVACAGKLIATTLPKLKPNRNFA